MPNVINQSNSGHVGSQELDQFNERDIADFLTTLAVAGNVSPSTQRCFCRDKRSGILWRHHIGEEQFTMAFKRATRLSGINQNGVPHLLRHSLATHLVECGTNIQTVQKLMGHKDVKTTIGYVLIDQKLGVTLHSPIDTLPAGC